ncbi:MAG: GGDEF domain-containing protein [Geminicoccales bacterium]
MRHEPPRADAACLGDWRDFHAELRRAAVAATQTGTPLSLLMLEIAGQAPGRPEGIALRLGALADVIRTAVGQRSVLARYAEERLAVIMAETDLADAIARAERIGAAGDALPVVPAIGVAQFRDDESLNHLIERAGEALRRAKADRIPIAVAEPRGRRRPARPLCGTERACLCGPALCGLCGQ